jgi:hypothetical protein
MRRIALELPDGTLDRFDDDRPITFKTVSAASPWLQPGGKLKVIDVPDDHADAIVSGPVH